MPQRRLSPYQRVQHPANKRKTKTPPADHDAQPVMANKPLSPFLVDLPDHPTLQQFDAALQTIAAKMFRSLTNDDLTDLEPYLRFSIGRTAIANSIKLNTFAKLYAKGEALGDITVNAEHRPATPLLDGVDGLTPTK